jgi:hypothetical protein
LVNRKVNEFTDISLAIKNNLILEKFPEIDFEEFFLTAFSLIFSLKAKALNFEKIIKIFEEKKEKSQRFKILTNYLILIIQFLKCINININFLPNKFLQLIKSDDSIDCKKEMNKIKKSVNAFLIAINELFYKDILKYTKLDNFRVKFLIAKYKTGFILDINCNGLTKAVNDLYLSKK